MKKFSDEFCSVLGEMVSAENTALPTGDLVDVTITENDLVLVFRERDDVFQGGYYHWHETHVITNDQKDRLINIFGVLEF